VAGEVAIPATRAHVPEAEITVALSVVEIWLPPVQTVYHATRTRALEKFDVPAGTNIQADQVYEVLAVTAKRVPPVQLPPPETPLAPVLLDEVVILPE
jgi:hypothetical protein